MVPRLFPFLFMAVGAMLLPVGEAAHGSTDPGGTARIRATPPAPASAPPAVRTTPVGPSAPLRSSYSPAVGALFLPGQNSHYCSAAVVRSASRHVVMTAAHCLSGAAVGLRFVPGYRPDGTGPAGSWTVTAAYADPAWLADRDPAHDYAFLSVAAADGAPRDRSLEAAVGSVGALDGGAIPGMPVTVSGYQAGAGDQQRVCVASTSSPAADGGTGPRVECPGFGTGTSGSPWMAATSDGDRVVGLIGGFHQGGCTDDVSHSPPFDFATAALLDRASAGGPGDVLPVPGSNGC